MRFHPLTVWLLLGSMVLAVLGLVGYQLSVNWWGQHHLQAAREALVRRDFRAAGQHLKKCLSAWPHDPDVLFLALRTARRQKDHDEFQRLLQRCQQHRVLSEPLSLEDEFVRFLQGDLSKAAEKLEWCIRHPDSPDCPLILEAVLEGCMNIANAQFAPRALVEGSDEARLLRAIHKGIELWFRVSRGRADKAQGLVWRGYAHILGSEYQKGLADFRAALDLDPSSYPARLSLAGSTLETEPKEAADHLRQLLSEYPERQEVRLFLALASRALGQLSEAKKLFDDVIAATPDHVEAVVERAQIAMDEGKPGEAEALLRRIKLKAPDDLRVLSGLIACLRLQGKDDEAKKLQSRFQSLELLRQQ